MYCQIREINAVARYRNILFSKLEDVFSIDFRARSFFLIDCKLIRPECILAPDRYFVLKACSIDHNNRWRIRNSKGPRSSDAQVISTRRLEVRHGDKSSTHRN